MGKFFAVISDHHHARQRFHLTRQYVQPVDISTHGHAIDEQTTDTMAEAGLRFWAPSCFWRFLSWKFSETQGRPKVFHLPGGAKLMVATAFILVGTEILALAC